MYRIMAGVFVLLLAWPALGLVVGTEVARRVRREPMPVLGALVVGLIVLATKVSDRSQPSTRQVASTTTSPGNP